MVPASRNVVSAFLAVVRRLESSQMVLARQKKTRAFLDKVDFDKPDVIAVVRRLDLKHYSYGPNQSDWGPGAVWHFGVEAANHAEVYVKLCLVQDRSGTALTCMSFHPSEQKMTFPYG